MPKAAWDTGVGRRAVNTLWVGILAATFAGLSFLLLYAVIAFWPPAAPADGSTPPDYQAQFLFWRPWVTPDQGLLLIVAVAGGLGAMGAVLRSFSRYVGERHLIWSWVPSYLLTPLVGALFATVIYFLLRAGLITGNVPSQGNAFGFVAVAALVGLFTSQAATKLKDIFETIFKAQEAGSESIEAASSTLGIASFAPESGKEGESVEISGTGLAKATAVVFAGDVSADAAFDPDTGTLQTTVPGGATSGPVSVTVGSQTATSEEPFTVEQ